MERLLTVRGRGGRGLTGQGTRRDIASASALAFAGRISSVPLLMAVAVITSRALGPEGRGQFVIATIFIGLLGAALNGLSVASVYQLSNRGRRPAQVVANAAVVGIAFGAVAVVVALATGFMLEGYARTIAILVALAAAPLILRDVVAGLFLGRGEMVNHSLALYGSHLISVGAMLVVFAGLRVASVEVALGIWVGAILASLFLVLPAWFRITGLPGRADLDRAVQRSMGRFAAIAGSYSLIAVVNLRVDLLVLSWIRGSHETGVYSAAVTLADPLLYFGVAIALATAAEVGRRPGPEAAELAARAVRHTLIITIPMAIMVLAAAGLIVSVLFGSAFSPAAGQMRILAVAAVLFAPVAVLQTYFVQQLGRPRYGVWVGTLSLLTAVSLSVAMAPVLGMTGVAVARLVSYVLSMLVASYLFLGASKMGIREFCVIRRQDFAPYLRIGRGVFNELRAFRI